MRYCQRAIKVLQSFVYREHITSYNIEENIRNEASKTLEHMSVPLNDATGSALLFLVFFGYW
jgi:hypothetical protein